MTNVTRTIYASALQTSQVLGIDYDIVDNTTLNEKFGILPEQPLTAGTYPVMKYIVAGRGGHRNATGADGASLTNLNIHKSSDAALFSHLPFVIREADNDLSVAARANYALRREEVIEGTPYIVYYALRISNDNIDIEYNRITVEDGNSSSVPYTPTSSDLSPTPDNATPEAVNVSDGTFISANAAISIVFNASVIEEMVAAATILYGAKEYATLSEIGLVTGQDFTNQAVNSEGGAFTYNEVVGAQLNTHITSHYQLWLLSSNLTLSFNFGGSESLNFGGSESASN